MSKINYLDNDVIEFSDDEYDVGDEAKKKKVVDDDDVVVLGTSFDSQKKSDLPKKSERLIKAAAIDKKTERNKVISQLMKLNSSPTNKVLKSFLTTPLSNSKLIKFSSQSAPTSKQSIPNLMLKQRVTLTPVKPAQQRATSLLKANNLQLTSTPLPSLRSNTILPSLRRQSIPVPMPKPLIKQPSLMMECVDEELTDIQIKVNKDSLSKYTQALEKIKLANQKALQSANKRDLRKMIKTNDVILIDDDNNSSSSKNNNSSSSKNNRVSTRLQNNNNNNNNIDIDDIETLSGDDNNSVNDDDNVGVTKTSGQAISVAGLGNGDVTEVPKKGKKRGRKAKKKVDDDVVVCEPSKNEGSLKRKNDDLLFWDLEDENGRDDITDTDYKPKSNFMKKSKMTPKKMKKSDTPQVSLIPSLSHTTPSWASTPRTASSVTSLGFGHDHNYSDPSKVTTKRLSLTLPKISPPDIQIPVSKTQSIKSQSMTKLVGKTAKSSSVEKFKNYKMKVFTSKTTPMTSSKPTLDVSTPLKTTGAGKSMRKSQPSTTRYSIADDVPTHEKEAESNLIIFNKDKADGINDFMVSLHDYYFSCKGGTPTTIETKGVYTFECHLCITTLSNNFSAMMHMLQHAESRVKSKKFSRFCVLCYRFFNSCAQLSDHVEKIHNNTNRHGISNINSKNSDEFYCQICEVDCPNKTFFKKHMMMSHQRCEMPYRCQLCLFASSSRADVIGHFKEHHRGTADLLCFHCLKVIDVKPKGKVKVVGKNRNDGVVLGLLPYFNHFMEHANLFIPKKCDSCALTLLSSQDYEQHKLEAHVATMQLLHSRLFRNQISRSDNINNNFINNNNFLNNNNNSNKSNNFSLTLNVKLQFFDKVFYLKPQWPRLAGYKCLECNTEMDMVGHLQFKYRCPLCVFVTCCPRSHKRHISDYHDFTSRRSVAVDNKLLLRSTLGCMSQGELFCECGYMSCKGDVMACHMVSCLKVTCFTSQPTRPQAPYIEYNNPDDYSYLPNIHKRDVDRVKMEYEEPIELSDAQGGTRLVGYSTVRTPGTNKRGRKKGSKAATASAAAAVPQYSSPDVICTSIMEDVLDCIFPTESVVTDSLEEIFRRAMVKVDENAKTNAKSKRPMKRKQQKQSRFPDNLYKNVHVKEELDDYYHNSHLHAVYGGDVIGDVIGDVRVMGGAELKVKMEMEDYDEDGGDNNGDVNFDGCRRNAGVESGDKINNNNNGGGGGEVNHGDDGGDNRFEFDDDDDGDAGLLGSCGGGGDGDIRSILKLQINNIIDNIFCENVDNNNNNVDMGDNKGGNVTVCVAILNDIIDDVVGNVEKQDGDVDGFVGNMGGIAGNDVDQMETDVDNIVAGRGNALESVEKCLNDDGNDKDGDDGDNNDSYNGDYDDNYHVKNDECDINMPSDNNDLNMKDNDIIAIDRHGEGSSDVNDIGGDDDDDDDKKGNYRGNANDNKRKDDDDFEVRVNDNDDGDADKEGGDHHGDVDDCDDEFLINCSHSEKEMIDNHRDDGGDGNHCGSDDNDGGDYANKDGDDGGGSNGGFENCDVELKNNGNGDDGVDSNNDDDVLNDEIDGGKDGEADYGATITQGDNIDAAAASNADDDKLNDVNYVNDMLKGDDGEGDDDIDCGDDAGNDLIDDDDDDDGKQCNEDNEEPSKMEVDGDGVSENKVSSDGDSHGDDGGGDDDDDFLIDVDIATNENLD